MAEAQISVVCVCVPISVCECVSLPHSQRRGRCLSLASRGVSSGRSLAPKDSRLSGGEVVGSLRARGKTNHFHDRTPTHRFLHLDMLRGTE